VCGVLATGIQDASAQTTAQFPIRFDFLNPGARSLAMGSAFIGAADDATAAFTNPAGLAFFGTRQVSIEGRFKQLDTPYLAGGRVSGSPTGIGADTIAGPVRAIDTDSELTPSFIAVVLPIGGRMSFTAYRHDLVRVSNTFVYSGAFQLAPFFGQVQTTRDIPLSGTRDVSVVNYGGSIARSWLNEQLALGAGVAISVFHLDSSFARHGFVSDIYSPVDLTLIGATATQSGDDIGVTANVGALWRTSDNRLSIGTTYRHGARFSFTQHDVVRANDLDLTRTGRFNVPDVWGAGFAWRLSDTWRIVADYDRVQDSQIKSDFIDFQALSSGRQAQLTVDDANEIHAGVEYRLSIGGRSIALRGGTWYDPAPSVRYTPTAANDAVDVLLSAMLPGGTAVEHYTFGAGVALPKRAVLDFAGDLSSQTRYLSASLLLRF